MNEQPRHPEEGRLEAFAKGLLDLRDIEDIQGHLRHCRSCCQSLDNVKDDHLLALVRRASPKSPITASQETTAEAKGYTERRDVGTRTATSHTHDDPPSELVNHERYRILCLIGRGGMGDVYKAEHRLMRRTVALKVINRQLTDNPEAVERFQREVRAAASLTHPNVVAAYDADQAGDIHFLAMEFVEGTNLADVVRTRGPLAVVEACSYIEQTAQALEHARQRGMVHRDVKPQNLMLTAHGMVKVLDFGLASLAAGPLAGDPPQGGDLTACGMVIGTPDYISPEQAADARSVDTRSDIYSLGATFYFLLTGQPPFAKDSVAETLSCHATHSAQRIDKCRPDVPKELADVICRMMEKDPTKRFQTPIHVAEVLGPFVENRVPPRVRYAVHWAARTRLSARVIMLLAATIIVISPILLYRHWSSATVSLLAIVGAAALVALGAAVRYFERPRKG